MALPPNQSNSLQSTMRSREMQQYQEFSMKEALKTATKAGLFTAVSNQIANSTVIRRIPGMASVREGMELKKRELYERTGRDESGRKLTKRELEDRELRRKDAGALASIWELLDQDWRNGVPVVIKGMESAAFAMMSGFGSNAAGGERFRPISREYGRSDNVTIASSGEGAYDIQDESSEKLQRREEAAEQERADDADQDRDQEKEEGFFTNLFSKTFGSRDRSKSGGLIDSLLGIVGPLLGIFGGGGGIIGMLSGIVAPLMGVLATAGTAIVGFITPLLPVIIGGILVGAAGLAIKSWINSLIDSRKNPAEAKGVTRAYTYTDPATGEKSAKTAAELGTTDEDIATGKFNKPGLNKNPYFVETENGKATTKLGTPYVDRRSPEQVAKGMAAYRDLIGERLSYKGGKAIQGLNIATKQAEEAGFASEEQRKELRAQLYALDTMMYSFVSDAGKPGGQDPSNIANLAKRWNDIREKAIKYKTLAEQMGIENNALFHLDTIAGQYAPFNHLVMTVGKDEYGFAIAGINPQKAVALVGHTERGSALLIPGYKPGDRIGDGGYDYLRGSNLTLPPTLGEKDIEEFTKFKVDRDTMQFLPDMPGTQDPLRDLDYLGIPSKNRGSGIKAKDNTSGNFVTTLSAALNQARNGMMGGGQAPVIINNNNSPTSNVMASASARTPTGIDLSPMFNGARLAAI